MQQDYFRRLVLLRQHGGESGWSLCLGMAGLECGDLFWGTTSDIRTGMGATSGQGKRQKCCDENEESASHGDLSGVSVPINVAGEGGAAFNRRHH